MLRKLTVVFLLLVTGLSMTGFGAPSALAEEDGNPWWIWILIFLAFVAFLALVLWWWMRSHEEEEASVPVRHETVAAVEEPAPEAPPEPEVVEVPELEPVSPPAPRQDDLKRIEGIGPKISAVLQAAGISTFAQLADTSVEQLRDILEAADPNLLRLAKPDTWPEQAQLAASSDWEALKGLQNGLRGGRRV